MTFVSDDGVILPIFLFLVDLKAFITLHFQFSHPLSQQFFPASFPMSPPYARSSIPLSSFFFMILISNPLVQLLGFGWAFDKGFVNHGELTCGEMDAAFPLRTADPRDYCFHASYELECQEDNVVVTMKSRKYRVLRIAPEKQSMTIVGMDLFKNKCPEQGDFVLDKSLFSLTDGDSNATLFYNCNPPLEHSHSNFHCHEGEGFPVASLLIMSDHHASQYAKSCSNSITIPILKSSVPHIPNYMINGDEVLKNGFEVKWVLDMRACKNCSDSKRKCAYSTTSKTFNCFTPDGAHGSTCAGPGHNPAHPPAPAHEAPEGPDVQASKKKTVPKVVIGVAVGGGTALILVSLFLCLWHHNGRKSGLSYFVSRSILSAFSSRTDSERGGLYYGLLVFDYRELQDATNNFDPQRILGDGGFGTVFYGKLRDGRAVAVKRVYENNYKRVEQFMNEVEILARLRHPNLVRLYGCTSRQSHRLLLVYEYVANGTVADHLHGDLAKPGSLPWTTRLKIAIETARALVYLHASDIVHRDVKTNNILLDENFSVKVADFGLSRLFPFNVTHISTAPQGTPGYMDPEYHQCYQLTDKSDVYSFGVVLMELISSLPAVDITRHRHEINLSTMAINKILSNELHELVDPNLGFDSSGNTRKMIMDIAELGFQCLQNERELRPSMAEVLSTVMDISKQGRGGDKEAEESDEVVLLKTNRLMPSPDSVMDRFASTATTSNASG